MRVAALHFRVASDADIKAVVALVESAYRGESSKSGWTTEADFLDGQRTDASEVSTLLRAPHSHIVLAMQDQILLACAHIQLCEDGCHFGMFAVSPTQQSHGVGKALLQECERRAQLNFGAKKMLLSAVWLRESLIAFYQRRGYALNGNRSEFPYGDARFGVPRRPDLYFLEMEKEL
jgi:GNAT superfamily N-acetyltransferase